MHRAHRLPDKNRLGKQNDAEPSSYVKEGFCIMTNELQEPFTEPQSQNNFNEGNIVSTKPKKTHKLLWVTLSIVFGVLCLCSVICIAAFALGVGKTALEKEPIESVLDSYMSYMTAKDVDKAYALFSPRARRQLPISIFQEMIEGNNYIIFEGYQSLTAKNINMGTAANTNPDMPQGTVAKVTGTIMYKGGIQGTFNAILEKVDDIWMLDGMYVTVPPSKIK